MALQSAGNRGPKTQVVTLIPGTLGRSVNWKTMGPNQCRVTEVFENMIKISSWKFYWDYRTSLSPNPCQDPSQEFLLLISELEGLS